MLGAVHDPGIPAADDWLLGESFDGISWRLLDDYGEWREPAESSSDVQL